MNDEHRKAVWGKTSRTVWWGGAESSALHSSQLDYPGRKPVVKLRQGVERYTVGTASLHNLYAPESRSDLGLRTCGEIRRIAKVDLRPQWAIDSRNRTGRYPVSIQRLVYIRVLPGPPADDDAFEHHHVVARSFHFLPIWICLTPCMIREETWQQSVIVLHLFRQTPHRTQILSIKNPHTFSKQFPIIPITITLFEMCWHWHRVMV